MHINGGILKKNNFVGTRFHDLISNSMGNLAHAEDTIFMGNTVPKNII